MIYNTTTKWMVLTVPLRNMARAICDTLMTIWSAMVNVTALLSQLNINNKQDETPANTHVTTL